MEIRSKVELNESPLKKWWPLAAIGVVAYFGAWFFLRMFSSGMADPEMAGSFMAPGGAGQMLVPLAVGLGGVAGFIIVNDKKKEIKALLFDDESKILTVHYKPYWGANLRARKIPYAKLNYRKKEEERIGKEAVEYLMIHNGLKAVARFTPSHVFWAKHRLAYKNLLQKLEKVRKDRK